MTIESVKPGMASQDTAVVRMLFVDCEDQAFRGIALPGEDRQTRGALSKGGAQRRQPAKESIGRLLLFSAPSGTCSARVVADQELET